MGSFPYGRYRKESAVALHASPKTKVLNPAFGRRTDKKHRPTAKARLGVSSTNPNVDPIGSCIGERGRRIANIINELGGEKVDLIAYSEDPEEFISNALSPAKNLNVSITDEKKKEALVIADDENLSLAIGKKGINIKLASKLTKYTINIKTLSDINAQINK